MISSDYIRGYNDLMILALLKESDSYAYSLSKKMDLISNGKYIIKETTLYSAFTRLEKNGYIENYFMDEPSGGTKRKYYHLTKKGEIYLAEKKLEWEVTKLVVDKTLTWEDKNE